jgi:endonuclease/exonuclease/phosphatase family metal-dependent hydrolase
MPESINIEPVPSRRSMSWVSKVIWVLNWFAIGSLLLSILAPFVNPAVFWPLAFWGLLFPAFLLVNVIFLLYWWWRKRNQGWFTLIAILISIPYWSDYLQPGFNHNTEPPTKGINIVSYNVKLFDLYNWSNNKQSKSIMFNQLNSLMPEVLCVQEFYTEDAGANRNLDSLKNLLVLPYVHAEYTITLRKDDHWGIATFSRYPIVNQGRIQFNNRTNNICIYTDITVGNDTIRVYNMHLQSLSLGYADLNFLKNPEQSKDDVTASKNILRRMKAAYIKRSGQANAIAKHIAECRYPVIVCGDFNDTPNSYSYRTIKGNMNDAFIKSGKGFGQTFINDWPAPRIDYILFSNRFTSYQFKIHEEMNISDHYPISTKLVLHPVEVDH